MRTLKLLLCLSLITYHFSLSAQSWDWAIKDSGTGSQGNAAAAIIVDSIGNSYVTGSFQGSTYFNSCGNITYRGERNFFLAKYNNSGTCLWVQTAGANASKGVEGNAIAVDRHGNILVTGGFVDSVDFGATKLKGGGFFVAKYDNNGNLKWVKGCPGTIGLGGISVDKKCHVYITGIGSGNLGGCALSGGFFMEKLDSNGNCIWVKGDPKPRPLNGGGLIKIDSAQNIYLCGDYGDTLTLGSHTLYPPINGHEYTFIAKFDSSGNYLWAKGGYLAGLTGIGIDKWDNVYVTGNVGGSTIKMDFGCDTIAVSANSSFIVKLTGLGNCAWNEPINNGYCYYGLHVNPNGTSDLVCNFSTSASINSCTFGNGPGIFVVGLDSAGNCNWSQTAGYCEPYGIDCDYSGNCYIAGGISANTAFGSISLTNSSNQSILVAKLGVPIGTGTGHSPVSKASTFNIYPNPSAGGYNLDISPNLLNSQLTICDVQGKVVFQTTISQQNPQINIPTLAKGMYYVQLLTPQGLSLEKTIVKQ